MSATCIVPEIHSDYGYEYKLGYEAGVEANATCPIKNSMVDPLLRREAWWAGWKARRKALGKPQMRPMRVGRLIAPRALEVAQPVDTHTGLGFDPDNYVL